MFATHYHELTALEGALPGVRNYNITAKKQGGDLIFLRKIVKVSADDSYGIEVAKLAGVPEGVIRKAKEYLAALEKGKKPGRVKAAEKYDDALSQLTLGDMGGSEVLEKLRATYLDVITPIEAMNLPTN